MDDAEDFRIIQDGRKDPQSDGNDDTHGRSFHPAHGTDNNGPATVQEQDSDQGTPSNVSGCEQLVLSAGFPIKREPEALDRREHDHQEGVVEQPTGIPPGQTPGYHVATVSECECQQLGNALNTNLLQFWAEPRRVVSSGMSSPHLTRQQAHSMPSRLFYLTFMFIARYAHWTYYSKLPFDKCVHRKPSPMEKRSKTLFPT